MTIMEAINRVDALKPNGYLEAEKMAWLSQLDGAIKKQVIDTHEGGEGVSFTEYGEETPMETELLVKAPYDRMYVSWLQTMIDYHNGEYGKFNNSNAVFSAEYSDFERAYNRSHMPLGKKIRYF